jgi:glycosyltransferase involved in cell wall biosynthesis
VVSGSWVDRLRAAAYHAPAIASVTPLSNDATICSYPGPGGAPLPPDVSAATMDGLCARVNAGMRVAIPSGVGFCMYVRGAALGEVGLLDETTWGRGYAEENDWCLKADAVGWSHVVALDVFVHHRGAVSFGSARKAAVVERNLELLAERYPEYHRRIQVFEARDPLRFGRNRIAIARLRERLARFKHRLLLVSHGLGGGVDAHCDDMERRLTAEGVGVLRAAGRGPRDVELTLGSDRACYQMPDDLDDLCADVGRLGMHAVHLHSDLGAVRPLWTLGDRLGLETHVTLHDYTPVCPRVNFTWPDGRYCGEPVDPARCDACIASFGAHEGVGSRFVELGRSIDRWRRDYAARLGAVERVYVPDADVADRYGRYFPDVSTCLRPHPADPRVVSLAERAPEGALVRVVVVGAIGPHKGLEVLLGCAREAEAAGRRLHFTVIGYTSDAAAVSDLAGVAVSGTYDREHLPEMLRAEPHDVALLPSRWPETYSYTLSETLSAGIPPVVFDIGAPARRVRALGVGAVLALGASPTEINDALVRVAHAERPETLELTEGRYPSLLADYYGLLVDP